MEYIIGGLLVIACVLMALGKPLTIEIKHVYPAQQDAKQVELTPELLKQINEANEKNANISALVSAMNEFMTGGSSDGSQENKA